MKKFARRQWVVMEGSKGIIKKNCAPTQKFALSTHQHVYVRAFVSLCVKATEEKSLMSFFATRASHGDKLPCYIFHPPHIYTRITRHH
jgi:hypothetical protein